MSGPRAALAALALLAAAAAAPLAACDTISADEAACEEATARLESCCPGLSARGAICDGPFSLTGAEARCVLAAACADLLDTSLGDSACATAALRFQQGTAADGGLCP